MNNPININSKVSAPLMFANINRNFRDVLDHEFAGSDQVIIASGYTSLDIIESFKDKFIDIAKRGGTSKLLLGMAVYEGLSQKKLDALMQLNKSLIKASSNSVSGVYVTNGRRYHGKVYRFDKDGQKNIYVGSSNFSTSGTKGNIECTVPILDALQKNEICKFLDDLYSVQNSIEIHKIQIPIPATRKALSNNKVKHLWNNLPKHKHSPNTLMLNKLPYFEFDLTRVVEKEQSNLNAFFGTGRLNRSTGITTPRPWYEVELIADIEITSDPNYPQGDFTAYTDDGLTMLMSTQGDYKKNIRSKHSLQLFGLWIKGRLEQSGALKKYDPVTLDTLQEYGNDKLIFYKFGNNNYYLYFPPNVI